MHFFYVHLCFLLCFRLVYLQSIIHQHLWNSLVLTPTTTAGVHSLSVHAGVDDIYFALNSRQQVVYD